MTKSNVLTVKHPTDMTVVELENYIKQRFVELYQRVNRCFNQDGRMTQEQINHELRDAKAAHDEIKGDPIQDRLFTTYLQMEEQKWHAQRAMRKRWSRDYMRDQIAKGIPDRDLDLLD